LPYGGFSSSVRWQNSQFICYLIEFKLHFLTNVKYIDSLLQFTSNYICPHFRMISSLTFVINYGILWARPLIVHSLPYFSLSLLHASLYDTILYSSILLHCIVQWVLQVMVPSAYNFIVLVFTDFHCMFRPTWPSSGVWGILFSYASMIVLFFFSFFHVVTHFTFPFVFFLCCFPSLFFLFLCVCVCLLFLYDI
jgi:hypothetical protein